MTLIYWRKMIERVRPAWTDEELKNIYDHQYDHTTWWDHIERIEHTIRIGNLVKNYDNKLKTVADLSAGDGAIANGIDIPNKILGDFFPAFEYVGKIEDTIKQIPKVDLFISSETLEHVDNPLEMLKSVRKKTRWLLLSTPENNWGDQNLEHYWAWDKEGVQELLEKAGFEPVYFESIPISYTHQIWICK
jgi:hypothetical protein